MMSHLAVMQRFLVNPSIKLEDLNSKPFMEYVNDVTTSLIHHQTTEDTEKLMDLRRHNIRYDFNLCALSS